MRFTRIFAGAMAIVAAVSTASTPAKAGDEDAWIAGAVGFGVGTLFGGALAQPRYYQPRPYYYHSAPQYYHAAPPVIYQQGPVYQQAPVYVQPAGSYAYRPAPWSPEWYSYCDNRYRSFNASNGYFLGYDGEYHFCQ